MKRVIAYVDGFNLYHSLERSKIESVKWLNIWKLIQSKLLAKDELREVLYFTALATWDNEKVQKHKNYIGALNSTGVKDIRGVFRRKSPKCRICRKTYNTFEEKRTDVNIAMHMLKDAYDGNMNKIVVVSGDSDLVPPIEMIRGKFPSIKIEVHVPFGGKAKELMKVAHTSLQYNSADLKASIFDEAISFNGTVFKKPINW